MFNVLTKTKLPPVINKVVVVIGLCGMFLGLLIGIHNDDPFPLSILCGAGFGFAFAAGSKYLVVKFMRAWMEGKLEQVSREREEARRKAEELKGEEDDATRHQV
jgi:hypothetical protein